MIISVGFDGLKEHIDELREQEQAVLTLIRLLDEQKKSVTQEQAFIYDSIQLYISQVKRERDRIIIRRNFLTQLLDETQKAYNTFSDTATNVNRYLSEE